MKTKLVIIVAGILIIPWGSLIYCQGNNPVAGSSTLSSFNELYPEVDSILREFVDRYCPEEINKYLVIKLYIYSYVDSTVFILTHGQFLNMVFQTDLSGYIKIKNCLIIVYSDLNRLFRSNPAMISNLKKELSLKHLKNIGDVPTHYDYVPWIISIHRETNKIKVYKKKLEPYYIEIKVDSVKY